MRLKASSSRRIFPSSTHANDPRIAEVAADMAAELGVERTFPLHSPRLDKITVLRHGKVRRAKLYYLRNLSGKAAKIKEK